VEDETEDVAQKVTLKGIPQLWLRTPRIIEERTTATDNRPKLFRDCPRNSISYSDFSTERNIVREVQSAFRVPHIEVPGCRTLSSIRRSC
jgi:hypothetical protein